MPDGTLDNTAQLWQGLFDVRQGMMRIFVSVPLHRVLQCLSHLPEPPRALLLPRDGDVAEVLGVSDG